MKGLRSVPSKRESAGEDVLEEVKGLAGGGSFGSIMGRNAFQRPKDEAIKLLHDVMDIYKGSAG